MEFNGLTIYRSKDDTAFIPLPRKAWRSAGRCACSLCQGNEGFWDTLVVPTTGHTYTVHMPHPTPNLRSQR